MDQIHKAHSVSTEGRDTAVAPAAQQNQQEQRQKKQRRQRLGRNMIMNISTSMDMGMGIKK